MLVKMSCHKHLGKNEVPCQTVCNKMALDPNPGQLKNLEILENFLISKRILFKETAIIHGKD